MSEHAVMPITDYVSACDTIRSKTGGTEVIKSGEMAAQIEAVYEAGKSQGGTGEDRYEEGYNAGIEQGKQTQKANFEQALISGMVTTGYVGDYLFAGKGWNNDTFYIKGTIRPKRANYMFAMSGIKGDLADMCEKRGTIIDLSNCTMCANLYANANAITRIGIIDISKATSCGNLVINCSALVTIDKLISSATTKHEYYNFQNCGALKNLTVEGVIGKNDFNVQWCTKLTKASLTSIVNCLSADTSGLSVTLSLTAVKKAFETSSGANDGNTSEEWLNLIATKTNWTIKLV